MICRGCQADLRHVNMLAEWSQASGPRLFQLTLECPHCAACYQLADISEEAFRLLGIAS